MSSQSPPLLRVATRKSPLALWQAEHVAKCLSELGVKVELVPLVSGGDTDMRPIDGTRQVGLFTKRIQQALLDDEADVAVHSLKDLPTEPDSRLSLAAVPGREVVGDSLVSSQAWDLESLPTSARVGTGSRRRAAQLRSIRPDLEVLPIRGNVQTRLSKLESGDFDAIMLAEAGVLRLGMDDLSRTLLSLDQMLPAPGQGALGIEVRSDDAAALQWLARLDDQAARAAVVAERKLLAALHGGCLAPIAAYGSIESGQLTLKAVVLSPDGKQRLDEQGTIELGSDGWEESAVELSEKVSAALIARGARELIEDNRE